MNHYEIIQLIHPNQSPHVEELVARQKTLIAEGGGHVHRYEDWGRLHTTYFVKKNHKAHYLLLNVECEVDAIEKFKQSIFYNDIVLRFLIVRQDHAVTDTSCVLQAQKEEADNPEANKNNKNNKNKDNSDRTSVRVSVKDLDYKNVPQLSRFLTEDYKILPARITGAPRKLQIRLKKAVKRARFLALLPYCDSHKI